MNVCPERGEEKEDREEKKREREREIKRVEILLAGPFVLASTWKRSKYPSTGTQTNKLWNLKMNKLLMQCKAKSQLLCCRKRPSTKEYVSHDFIYMKVKNKKN